MPFDRLLEQLALSFGGLRSNADDHIVGELLGAHFMKPLALLPTFNHCPPALAQAGLYASLALRLPLAYRGLALPELWSDGVIVLTGTFRSLHNSRASIPHAHVSLLSTHVATHRCGTWWLLESGFETTLADVAPRARDVRPDPPRPQQAPLLSRTNPTIGLKRDSCRLTQPAARRNHNRNRDLVPRGLYLSPQGLAARAVRRAIHDPAVRASAAPSPGTSVGRRPDSGTA